MQTTTLGAFEARRKFGKILETVGYKGGSVVVEKNGEELVAIVPVEMLRQWEREREAFFEEMREVSERSDLSEEETTKLVAEAVQAIRAQQ